MSDGTNSGNFFAELKRRNVYKVAVAYAIVAWLLIQVATQVFPFFEIPNWTVRLVVLLLILGFPIALFLAWAFEITPEGIKRAEDVSPNESITHHTGRKLVWLTVMLAVIAAGLLAFQLLRPKSATTLGASTTPASASAALPEKSIAVLPFENLSRDPDNAFFTDGVQDEILTDLAKVADLKVISRTSVMHYKSGVQRNLREIAIQSAFRLRPDAGEAHLARAENLYRGYLDYDGALAELEIARRTLPNDPSVFELTAYIVRRQGKHEEALRYFKQAVELDPRNFFTLQQMALSYQLLRRYAEKAATLDRALAITPDDIETKVIRAVVALDWKADTHPLHQTIDSVRQKNPAGIQSVADSWFACALAERDPAAAERAVTALGENNLSNDSVYFNRSWAEGVIGRMMKDNRKAQAAFTAARAEQEKIVQAQPNYGPALCVLGLIDAGLGRKEDALREVRRAVELLPPEKDSINGLHMIEYFAMAAAWVGEKDLACEQLAIVTRVPGSLSYGQLKLLPYWDPLRGDTRFEKIVASLAPKD